ncbi:MAG: radical SAM protein [bacterium]
MKVFSAPQKVTLNITNQCNLYCLYCAVSSTKNAPGDLSIEEWKDVIDELARIKVFYLLISGGEPFIRQDFSKIIEHISQYHFRISINTNGTLCNKEILSLLSRSCRVDDVQVSLDGADPDVHDMIRGKGSFEKMLKGIKLLHQWEIPFSFFVVVCKNNKDQMERIVRFAEGAGASRVSFSSLLPQGSALSHFDDLFLSFDEQKYVDARLRKLKREYPRLVSGSLMQGIEMMDTISKQDISSQTSGSSHKITSCGGSVKECSIRPEGWVIPCDRLWDFTVGNVRDEPFQAIWLNSEGFRYFRKRYSRGMDFFNECRDCEYINMCSGGCPAVPFNMGRGIEGWDPLSCYKVFIGKKRSYIR